MSKIAIKSISFQNLVQDLNLKRDILLFDKLIIDKESYNTSKQYLNSYFQIFKDGGRSIEMKRQNFLFNEQNIEFLEGMGFVEILDLTSDIEIRKNKDDRSWLIMEDLLSKFSSVSKYYKDPVKKESPTYLKAMADGFTQLSDVVIRLYCIKRITEGLTSNFPILQTDESLNNLNTISKNYVIKFILNRMPEPSDEVSWEQIIDFRSDLDTKAKYYNLLNWINEISKNEMRLDEFEEKYYHLYYDYLNQFKIHKIKSKGSMIEIAINGISELLENTVKLKFGKITRNLFSFFKDETTLVESEQNITGRELAYIHKTMKNFKQNGG